MQTIADILGATWLLLGEMAPYLLLGFAVAGLLSVFASRRWIERHLGGGGIGPVARATVFGIPLPLCSCGVIPVAAGLRRQGASRGATSAFLLATPQTGVDSILATYALLGPVFAIVRPLVALVTGLVGGVLIDRAGGAQEPAPANDPPADDCCHPHAAAEKKAWPTRIHEAAVYGLINLPREITRPLLIGALVAGALTVLVDENALAPLLGGRWLGPLIMMAIGIPLYVCATGSIPLAVAFLHLGASPGAALAFLIAGPATNAATIGVNWSLLGRRSTVLYLLTAAAAALFSGYALDALAIGVDLRMPLAGHAHHDGGPAWMIHAWAALLLALLIATALKGSRAGSPDGHVGVGPASGA